MKPKRKLLPIPHDWFTGEFQRLNGNAICLGCRAVGRPRKLCLSCADRYVLRYTPATHKATIHDVCAGVR